MAPSSRCSAAPRRSSNRAATSSTYWCSELKATPSSAACDTRSRASRSPRTTRWAARIRRRRTSAITARTKARKARPAAATATMPWVVLWWSTPGRLRALPGEDDRLRLLVVVQLLLAGDLGDGDQHARRLPDRRRRGQGDGDLGRGARLRLVDRARGGDRLGAARHPHGHLNGTLVAVAAVGELHVEGQA